MSGYQNNQGLTGSYLAFNNSFTSISGSTTEKLGVTTTVKEQVENIQNAVQHFKRCIDQQRKQQIELDSHIRKLNQKTHKDFYDLLKQTTARATQQIETFRHQNDKQTKEFQFMDLQTSTLQQEHKNLRSISSAIGGRTAEIQSKVGV